MKQRKSKTVWVCNVCGLSLPHTDPRAIAHHKEQVKANKEVIKRRREQTK